MLEELVKNTILRNRPEHIIVKTYGDYSGDTEHEATYNDSKSCYETKVANAANQEVHSAKAFVNFIDEELKRRENLTGKFATSRITLVGGSFVADDNYNRGHCTYTRLNSEQYKILKSYKGATLDHEEFLTMLQKLKPSITDFPTLYQRCSKIRVVGRSEMNSQPMFDDEGNADASFICTYKLQDGTDEDLVLPASFECVVPFAKAGEKEYAYIVELLFVNTKSNQIAVSVQIPDWETNEEQAIIDEAEFVKDSLKDKTNLLVLADF